MNPRDVYVRPVPVRRQEEPEDLADILTRERFPTFRSTFLPELQSDDVSSTSLASSLPPIQTEFPATYADAFPEAFTSVPLNLTARPETPFAERPVTPLPDITILEPAVPSDPVTPTSFVRPAIPIESPHLPRQVITPTRRLTLYGGTPTRRVCRDEDPEDRWYSEEDQGYVVVGVNRRLIYHDESGVWWGNIVGRQNFETRDIRVYERVEYSPYTIFSNQYMWANS